MNNNHSHTSLSDRVGDAIEFAWATAFGAAALFSALLALLMIGVQCLAWLDAGTWEPLSLSYGLKMLGDNELNSWLSNGESWRGVKHLLDWIPLSLSMLVLAIVLYAGKANLEEGLRQKRKQRSA